MRTSLVGQYTWSYSLRENFMSLPLIFKVYMTQFHEAAQCYYVIEAAQIFSHPILEFQLPCCYTRSNEAKRSSQLIYITFVSCSLFSILLESNFKAFKKVNMKLMPMSLHNQHYAGDEQPQVLSHLSFNRLLHYIQILAKYTILKFFFVKTESDCAFILSKKKTF